MKDLISLMDEALNLLINLIYTSLFIGLCYFLLFYIFSIAKDIQNRAIKLFSISLLIGIVASSSILIQWLVILSYGLPIITTFIIVRFMLKVRVLMGLVLGTLYVVIK